MGLWTGVNLDPPKGIRIRPNNFDLTGASMDPPFGSDLTSPIYSVIEFARLDTTKLNKDVLGDSTALRSPLRAAMLDYAWSNIQEYMFAMAEDQWNIFVPVVRCVNAGNSCSSGSPVQAAPYRRCKNGALELSWNNVWSRCSYVADGQLGYGSGSGKPKYMRFASLRMGLISSYARSVSEPGAPTRFTGTRRENAPWSTPIKFYFDLGGTKFSDTIYPKQEWIGVAEQASVRTLDVIGFQGSLGNQPKHDGSLHRIAVTGINDSFTGDGTKKAFTLSATPINNDDVMVKVGGVTKKQTTDYTFTSSSLGSVVTVNFKTAPGSGQSVTADYDSGTTGYMMAGTLIYWSGLIGGVRKFAAAFVHAGAPENDYTNTAIDPWGSGVYANAGPIKLQSVVVGENTLSVGDGKYRPAMGFGDKIILKIKEAVSGDGPPTESGYCGVVLQFTPSFLDSQVWLNSKWESNQGTDTTTGWGGWARPQTVHESQNARNGVLHVKGHRDVVVATGETKRITAVTTVNVAGIRTLGLEYPNWITPVEVNESGSINEVVASGLTAPATAPVPLQSILAQFAGWSSNRFRFTGGQDEYLTQVSEPLCARYFVFQVIDSDRFLIAPRAMPLIPTSPTSDRWRWPTASLHKLRVLDCDDSKERSDTGANVPDPLRFDDSNTATLDRTEVAQRVSETKRDNVSTVIGTDAGFVHWIGQGQKALESMLSKGLFGEHMKTVKAHIEGKYTTTNYMISSTGKTPFAKDRGGSVTKRVKTDTWETDTDGTPLINRNVKIGSTAAPLPPYQIDKLYDLQFDELVMPPTPLIEVRGYESSVFPYCRVRAKLPAKDVSVGGTIPANPPKIKQVVYRVSSDGSGGMTAGSTSWAAITNTIGGVGIVTLPSVWPARDSPGRIGPAAPYKTTWNTANRIRVRSLVDLGPTITVRCIVLVCTANADLFDVTKAPSSAVNLTVWWGPSSSDSTTIVRTMDIEPTGADMPTITVDREVRAFTLVRSAATGSGQEWIYDSTPAGLALRWDGEPTDNWQYSNVPGVVFGWRREVTSTQVPEAIEYLQITNDAPGNFLTANGTFETLQNYFGTSLRGICSIDEVDPAWI